MACEEVEESDDEGEDAQEDDEDEMKDEDDHSTVEDCPNRKPQHFALTYRNVEDSIRTFDGDDAYPVEHWISDFEEMAEVMKWNDFQKFIFAKKALRGLPKLFVQGENNIKTWSRLKKSLTSEFGKTINSADLHSMLARRKMKPDETVYEYFLKMKELANRGKIENDALFQYVINGIPDESSSKIILYGARTISEFKEKLEVYSKMRNAIRKNTVYSNKKKADTTDKSNTTENKKELPKRCFNCGKIGHISKHCQSSDKGPRLSTIRAQKY